MKLVETNLTGESIRVRFADAEEAGDANEWIWFQVPLEGATRESGTPLPNPKSLHLAEVLLVALRRAHRVIGDEIRDLELVLDDIRQRRR